MKLPHRFVICDLESTGLDSESEIIELALITFEGNKVVDTYETLIDPQRTIPQRILELTGISKQEIKKAPKFYDISEKVLSRLQDSIFVSHNTEFDLFLLSKKFKELGVEFKIKDFCTLKEAQRVIPGLSNYNLDALCNFFGIKIHDRHRAYGDAEATLSLFLEIQKLKSSSSKVSFYLPLHEKLIKKIPERAGILSLKNRRGEVISIIPCESGLKKAKELLVFSYEKRNFLKDVYELHFEATGSPLIARIKSVQNRKLPKWGISSFINREGEREFRVNRFNKKFNYHFNFDSFHQAQKKLKSIQRKLLKDHFIYREGKRSKEEILKHNLLAEEIIKNQSFPTENLVIVGEGRSLGERSVILIRKNTLAGIGFTFETVEVIFKRPQDFLDMRFKNNPHVDEVGIKYLKELKNAKYKTESWRSLAL